MDPISLSNWTNIAVIGPAQHGKSSIAGCLLYERNEVKLNVIREARHAAQERGDPSRTFAYLLDRTPVERATEAGHGRGQTHVPSWWGFRAGGLPSGRRFLLMDSPGHYHRVAHVIGVLADADAVLLVLDVRDYLEACRQPDIRRDTHGQVIPNVIAQIRAYLSVAAFYGIERLVIAVNKMDLVQFHKRAFEEVKFHLQQILHDLHWKEDLVQFVPTAVDAANLRGTNITKPLLEFEKWYSGSTLAEAIERAQPRLKPIDDNFRLQVNQVFQGKRVRVPGYELVLTGKVLSGTVKVRDHLIIQPSDTRCVVRTIQSIDASRNVGRHEGWQAQRLLSAAAGEIVGLGCTITDIGHSDITVGDMAIGRYAPTQVGRVVRAELVVLHTPTVLRPFFFGRLSGSFGMGYFFTGFTIRAFSLDEGITWHQVGRDRTNPENALRVDDLVLGGRLLIEFELSRDAPLDRHVPGTEVGRFVVLDSNHFLLCGGKITDILLPSPYS